MGHRHCPHSFRLPMDQGHDGSHSTAEQSHSHTGRAPENGSLLHLQENVSRVGVSSSFQWSSGSRTHDYPSRYGVQIPQFQPSHSAASYDPVSSASRNLYLGSQGDGGFGQSNYNEMCHAYNDGSGLQDSAAGSRRGYKRKSPDSSIVCERGSTSSVNGAGSSSNPELQLPISGYQNVSSSHIGFSYCGGGVAINGEDPMRNVRSRSRFDLEASTMRNRFSSHSSHNYHPTSNPSGHYGAVDLNHTNVNDTNRVWSFNTLPATDGRTQISVTGTNESNQLLVRGIGTDNCYPRPLSGPNRNVVSSRQYHRAPPHWGARGGHSDLPGPSNPRFGGEAVSASSPMQSLPGTYSSRYSAQSTGGWRNYHRNGRSHAAVGRSRSVSHRANAHYRTGSENFTVTDGSSLNVRSRGSFDQYRSLRVDVDNMTYEELLALGERIGSVNTGLSEDMISNCLIEATNSLVQNREEEEDNCCICLEEYSNKDGVGIGTIKTCGHKYHTSCIRKWLSMKNACPICKTPAVGDGSKM